jgi:hypothetical protein
MSSGENHRDTLEAWFREPKSGLHCNILSSVSVIQANFFYNTVFSSSECKSTSLNVNKLNFRLFIDAFRTVNASKLFKVNALKVNGLSFSKS